MCWGLRTVNTVGDHTFVFQSVLRLMPGARIAPLEKTERRLHGRMW